MAHSYHHAKSSVLKWGGTVEDYLELHSWFDASKAYIADYRHRSLRHHAQGIAQLAETFGQTLTLSSGRVIPTRWVGEQHVREDLGRIPSFADWVRAIRPEPWMGRATKLGIEDDPRDPQHGLDAVITDKSLSLYFIAHANDDNADMGLLVWAEDLPTALQHWRTYFELEDELQPQQVFEVSDTRPRPGPIGWHRDEGLKCLLKPD